MPERDYERFLRRVLSRCLDAAVEHVDDGSRDGMHDGEVRYPDGRVAAVEFTTVGQPAALQMESFPTELQVPDTPFWWSLRYEHPGVLWRDISKHVPTLVALLDQRGMRDADGLENQLRGLPAWDWFKRHNLSLSHFGQGGRGRGGRVDVLPTGHGGVVDSQYHGLNPWIESMQAEPWWLDNVTKLVRSGRSELHLGLRVHETGVPVGLLLALMDGGPIRVGDPAGMKPLTDLWVVVSYGTNAAHWSVRSGWTAHNYATPEEEAASIKENSDAMKKLIASADRAAHGTSDRKRSSD